MLILRLSSAGEPKLSPLDVSLVRLTWKIPILPVDELYESHPAPIITVVTSAF